MPAEAAGAVSPEVPAAAFIRSLTHIQPPHALPVAGEHDVLATRPARFLTVVASSVSMYPSGYTWPCPPTREERV